MKKITSFITLAVILLMSVFPLAAFADGDGALYPIYDEPGFLTEAELTEVDSKLSKLRDHYRIDVTVIIEENMYGETAQETADDYFDYSGYGIGENSDGILLYISEYPREYHFSTHGSAIEIFNDRGLVYLESKVLPYLKEDNYYGAVTAYADTAEEMLEMAANGKPYNSRSPKEILIALAIALFAPLIIAFLLTMKKLGQMKTAVKQDYAANYMKPGSMNITASNDIFLYSTVTKTEKPKSSSGTHTSSSGETHGGRGGSY